MPDTPLDDPNRCKPLFTPGPLTTSRTVKEAMLRDLGSRDDEFIEIAREIRAALVDIAGLKPPSDYTTVLMQGSGTFCLESVITSIVPQEGTILAVVNGAYGQRMADIAARHKIPCRVLACAEDAQPDPDDVEKILEEDPSISTVAMVHCETTTGIMNPVEAVGQVVAGQGRTYVVDSMSAFGGVVCDYNACSIDYLISSANKCLQGVPGFGFVICRVSHLAEIAGWARSLSLDLHAQWEGLERNGQFRFTPPTHALLAFHQALKELDREGGVAGREARYRANYQCIARGMCDMGFREFLAPGCRGHVITSFHYPEDGRFEFNEFYQHLNDRGFVIYPGKVSGADCFRVGNIGHLFEEDMQNLLTAIKMVSGEMGIVMPPGAGNT